MRSSKGSHRIVVGGVQYRWRATGNDGHISVGIWPFNGIGAYIGGVFCYHASSAAPQIVVTNKIIRRIVEHALLKYRYDPHIKGRELFFDFDREIDWKDAVRATRKPTR
ncbi:MAG TPA: hypothetical protein VEJ63_06065 [Planctomycetota bacterium]|nr:hypothetical protein [Planctomycetota bacterium]